MQRRLWTPHLTCQRQRFSWRRFTWRRFSRRWSLRSWTRSFFWCILRYTFWHMFLQELIDWRTSLTKCKLLWQWCSCTSISFKHILNIMLDFRFWRHLLVHSFELFHRSTFLHSLILILFFMNFHFLVDLTYLWFRIIKHFSWASRLSFLFSWLIQPTWLQQFTTFNGSFKAIISLEQVLA